MKRFLPLALLFLVACESPGTLQWVSPTPHSTVGGSVILQVEAAGTPPENVVFSVNGQFIAKSYDLSAVWDTSKLPSGDYTLEAKPFGASPSYVVVSVHNVGATEPAPLENDPLELGPLLNLDVSSFREFISHVPPGIKLDLMSCIYSKPREGCIFSQNCFRHLARKPRPPQHSHAAKYRREVRLLHKDWENVFLQDMS